MVRDHDQGTRGQAGVTGDVFPAFHGDPPQGERADQQARASDQDRLEECQATGAHAPAASAARMSETTWVMERSRV